MRRMSYVAAITAVLAQAAADAQSSMMSAAMVGTGPHGYDWLIGTWTCKNTVPTALAGPAIQTFTVARSGSTGALTFRIVGKDYDQLGFISYVPKTKTWWYSWAYPGGSYGGESSKQTGMKTFWTGSVFDASSGTVMKIRDTYTVYGLSKFNDFGETAVGGVWRAAYNGTCTKT
jgi:hypothetical protein